MSEQSAVRVRVVDPKTGATLAEHRLKDHFLLLCHGSTYLEGEQYYPTTGTTILTIKRRDSLDGGDDA